MASRIRSESFATARRWSEERQRAASVAASERTPLSGPLDAVHEDSYEEELHWYLDVYRGDVESQLTFRAILMGSLLGGIMSLSNLYIGLKTGWSMGVALTACILSYACWHALMKVFPRLFSSEMTILENNCMQSTASSAGSSTGTTMVSGIAAYLMLQAKAKPEDTNPIPMPILMLWTASLGALGVFLAIPLKRQMINVERLRFPSGVAAAETLRSLHSRGDEASEKAQALGFGALFGASVAWLRDGRWPSFLAIPAAITFPASWTLHGHPLASWTIFFDMSTVLVAAGAIIGWRTSWSLMFGAIVNYTILAPWAVEKGAIPSELGFRSIVQWSTWGGAAIMVTGGIMQFAFRWGTIVRSFWELKAIFKKRQAEASHLPGDPLDLMVREVEVPGWWIGTGVLISGSICITILKVHFNVAVWMGVLAVFLTFFLSLVAVRATGESDITPVGAMGKVSQLLFGVLSPHDFSTNLMTASVTAGASSSAADLLTDLKSGYILGACPKQQFLAQFAGIFMGTAVVVPAFSYLIPDPSVLGSTQWPAPSAMVWKAVAELLSKGFSSLHYTEVWSLWAGAAIGLILPLLEHFFPRFSRYLPSATGLGLSMVIPFFNAFSMFLGASISTLLQWAAPHVAEKYIVPVCSGLIAGESLVGTSVVIYQTVVPPPPPKPPSNRIT